MVTPMFGGGFKAREPDPDNPVRATAVRGHLQFWWRATHSTSAGMNSRELFGEQEKIWGSTSQKSKVSVVVEDVRLGSSKLCAVWNQREDGRFRLHWLNDFEGTPQKPNPLQYVVFPFQGTDPAKADPTAPANYLQKTSFRLRVSFEPNHRPEVERSLRAWINFGGLGSRTRRGCGSLFADKWSFSSPQKALDWLKANCSSHVQSWSTLSGCLLFGEPRLDPMTAWKSAIRPFQLFRQGEGIGRNQGKEHNRPGRSRFPEPETIRQLVGPSDPKHQKLGHPLGFPRAEFGMPIIVHFQSGSDPKDTTILPENGEERMASPLILKAMATGLDEACPIILRLNTRLPDRVALKGARGIHPESTKLPVRSNQFGQITNSPMAGHSSALEGFLAFAKSEGFQGGGV